MLGGSFFAMASLDWSKLSPHRPLAPGDPAYVPRPHGSGARLADQVLAGQSRVAVVGPAGSGKSTELAAAEAHLALGRRVLRYQIEWEGSIERTLGPLYEALSAKARRGKPGWDPVFLKENSAILKENFLRLFRELSPVHGARFALLLDGLERIPAALDAMALIRLLDRAAENADLVFVVSPMMTTGRGAYEFVKEVVAQHVFELYALPGHPDEFKPVPTTAFFYQLLERRTGGNAWTASTLACVDTAIRCSGGLIREFLQLIEDTAIFDQLNRMEPLTIASLRLAARRHSESYRSLLTTGDEAALETAAGTDGVNLDDDVRARLLTHGLLLKYETELGSVLRPNPLVVPGWRQLVP